MPDPVLPRAVLFDMDGTLTEPLLDFPRIKAEMGIGDQPILEALESLGDDARTRAQAVLHRHEEHAAKHATLSSGCAQLLDWLAQRRIPTAVITRNRERIAAEVFQTFGLRMDLIIGRDSGLPFKPDPTPLREACRRLGVTVDQAWMVGDGEFDIAAGNRAAMTTVWLSHGRQRSFPHQPTYVADTLAEVHALLQCAIGPTAHIVPRGTRPRA